MEANDEPWQQRIGKFMVLIEKANQLQRELADTLIEALKIQKEVSTESNEEFFPIFEMITSEGEVSFVKDPYVVGRGSILDANSDLTDLGPESIDTLKNLGQIKMSAWKVCPAAEFAKSIISEKICGKSPEECEECSENEGWNRNGYEIDKIQLRPFNIEI